MTLFAPRDRSFVRSRLVRTALATTAAAACALGVATAPSPALARDGGSIPDAFAQRRPAPHVDQRRDHATPDPTFRALTPAAGATELGAKLGDRDLRTLQAAEVKGKKTVTVLLAVTPGDTAKVSRAVEGLDGSVGRAEEQLGYVRATVPVDAVRGLAALGDVRAIDLNRTYRVPDPHVTLNGSASVKARGIAAPGATTGADNPYLPVGETGAVDFVDHHRTWDGRGITVGILDTGRRPRPPGAPHDDERTGQGDRLGHRHRPGDRQRRHVAADGPGEDRARRSTASASSGPHRRATTGSPSSSRARPRGPSSGVTSTATATPTTGWASSTTPRTTASGWTPTSTTTSPTSR